MSDNIAETSQVDTTFILRLLRIFNNFDGPNCSDLWWRTDTENDHDYAPITFFVNCDDLFFWATVDCEDITPSNINILEQAVRDIQALMPDDYSEAGLLFCCRVRQMRPQRPYYRYLPEILHALFDACGPVRKAEDEG